MPSVENQIDPETRAEMAVLDAYPGDHWVNLHETILRRGLRGYELATTFMAHMTHAEVRELLAFLIGFDIQHARDEDSERSAE